MSNLKKKKLELDIMKVAAAKAELEYKIEERLQDIKRMKEHIELQEKRKIELHKELKELGE